MGELSELDEINRSDELSEDIKKEADAKHRLTYDPDDIQDEIMSVYHKYRAAEMNRLRPEYLILDGESYRKLLNSTHYGTVNVREGIMQYSGMKICVIRQNEELHYVQVA